MVFIVSPWLVVNIFCLTCLVISSIFFKTSGDKLSGIINPYDVCPSGLLNDKLISRKFYKFSIFSNFLIKLLDKSNFLRFSFVLFNGW
jgi:hypothetical protein